MVENRAIFSLKKWTIENVSKNPQTILVSDEFSKIFGFTIFNAKNWHIPLDDSERIVGVFEKITAKITFGSRNLRRKSLWVIFEIGQKKGRNFCKSVFKNCAFREVA